MRQFMTFLFLLGIGSVFAQEIGHTSIQKWPENKKAAVSITYDDGTLNQFHKALPVMESLGMRGTFYINTGEIPSSKYRAKFIGREVQEILEEASRIPTNSENLFERASLIRFLDMPDAVSYHDRAGAAFEQGRYDQAYNLIDEGLAYANSNKINKMKEPQIIDGPMIDWDEIRDYAQRGHEFGVHTISHPRLAVLDHENLLYELEKCREEIEQQLGKEFLFSAECPFGTEDERVMEYALEMFPATRNRMPELFLHEINRSGSFDPKSDYAKSYIQWQRGPLSRTAPELMRSWVDDILTRDDTWLVLVFHGIEGIGWEAISESIIKEYFEYIASKKDIWVGTFAEVTKYMRQRMNTDVFWELQNDELHFEINTKLEPFWYTIPLTLETVVPKNWENASLVMEGKKQSLEIRNSGKQNLVVYNVPAGTSSFKLIKE